MPSGPMPPPAPGTTPGKNGRAGMCAGVPLASASSTSMAAGRSCGMCTMWLIQAAGRRRAPSYGNTGQNTPGWCRQRWRGGLRYHLETTACRSSLNISPLSLRRTIGTSTRRTSSTSLTAVFWRSMMHITSVCSSKTPQPSAWPAPSCPGVD